MNALELSHALAAAALPPKRLEDVVAPGSLASFLAPGAWQPLREIAEKIGALREDERKVSIKSAEVEQAIRSHGARRVRDVARLASQVLAGEIPAPEREPEREGLAALSLDQLRAVLDGLRQRAQEVRADLEFCRGRARVVARGLLTDAARAIATRYVGLMDEAAALHRQLDAAERLADGSGSIVPPGWRDEAWRAPAIGTDPRRVVSDDLHGPSLAIFSDGAGVRGAEDAWRAAVRAATGLDFD